MSAQYDCADAQQREAGILASVTTVKAGGLVVLPTDTVYGLGADAFSPDAVAALLAAKGRGRNMPPPVLVGSVRAASALAETLGAFGQDLIDEFWPGPLTLVLRASDPEVGSRRHQRHGRGPDAAAPGGPGAAAAHRPAGGEQCKQDWAGRRDHRAGRAGAARRVGRGLPGRRLVRGQHPLNDRRLDRRDAAGAAGWRGERGPVAQGGDRHRPSRGRPGQRASGRASRRNRPGQPGRRGQPAGEAAPDPAPQCAIISSSSSSRRR